MTFHPRVLNDRQREALKLLGRALAPLGAYLGGGVGVGLHLGHRRSVDLDWFTRAPIDDPLGLAADLLAKGVPLGSPVVDRGTLIAPVKGVPTSIMRYDYPALEPEVAYPSFACKVGHLDDLACMKLSALQNRGAKKDFVDLYALMRRHRPLGELIGLYRRKYGIEDIRPLVTSLTYFDDADAQRMPIMVWDVDWRTIKSSLREEVRDLARAL
ncbi:nucleotidyl transferase AbiEii/AbiGii toxin family protein [Myxococcota bacterium]|nr:nucleotidyl transferase AbiEii/AbiGii toxin family protein [Myxococcota bacterium]